MGSRWSRLVAAYRRARGAERRPLGGGPPAIRPPGLARRLGAGDVAELLGGIVRAFCANPLRPAPDLAASRELVRAIAEMTRSRPTAEAMDRLGRLSVAAPPGMSDAISGLVDALATTGTDPEAIATGLEWWALSDAAWLRLGDARAESAEAIRRTIAGMRADTEEGLRGLAEAAAAFESGATAAHDGRIVPAGATE